MYSCTESFQAVLLLLIAVFQLDRNISLASSQINMFAKIQYDSQKRDSHHSCFYVSPIVTFTVTQAQQNVAEWLFFRKHNICHWIRIRLLSNSRCSWRLNFHQRDANKVMWRIFLTFIRIRSKSLPFCFSVELIWDTCLMMVRDPQGSDTASILPHWHFSLKRPRPLPPGVKLRVELPVALRAMRRLSSEGKTEERRKKAPEIRQVYSDLLCKKEVIIF